MGKPTSDYRLSGLNGRVRYSPRVIVCEASVVMSLVEMVYGVTIVTAKMSR